MASSEPATPLTRISAEDPECSIASRRTRTVLPIRVVAEVVESAWLVLPCFSTEAVMDLPRSAIEVCMFCSASSDENCAICAAICWLSEGLSGS